MSAIHLDMPATTTATASVTRFDYVLSTGALLLLGMTIVSLGKGYERWVELGPAIWIHLTAVVLALGTTPFLLLRTKRDRLHKSMGYLWVGSLAVIAVSSFFLKFIIPGSFSPIHLLSVWTLIQLPMIVMRARQKDIKRHRRIVRGVVAGGLIVAGIIAFLPIRLLGLWLYN
ncbi:DUF2306 domain-containing protein [Lacunimicrobium album]